MKTTATESKTTMFFADISIREYQAGRNEDGVFYRTAYQVTVTSEKGRRWIHDHSFDTFEAAEKLAARVETALEAGCKLRRKHWSEIDPAYGSKEYDRQGIELDRWMQERMDEGIYSF